MEPRIIEEPPQKKLRTESSFVQVNGGTDVSMRDGTPTEPNESFLYQQATQMLTTADGETPMALPPLPHPSDRKSEEKQAMILELFSEAAYTDYSNHAAIQQLSGQDLDLPLDQSANTALHWAATLARIPLMRLLIQKGASIFQGNIVGQTPLMAAVQVNNCLDHSCFPELLEILGPLIEVRDAQNRTILHHIAVSCGIKGRAASSKYYLEALLEFLVRNTSAGNAGPNKPIGLMRFMSEMVNARDKGGNTALNLVARIGNRSIIQQLLEVQADPSIPNYKGLRPVDFGVEIDPTTSSSQQQQHQQTASQPEASTPGGGAAARLTNNSKVEELNRELLPSNFPHPYPSPSFHSPTHTSRPKLTNSPRQHSNPPLP